MSPTLNNGDRLGVTAYDVKIQNKLQRGDVVICHYPGRTNKLLGLITVQTDFVKRIVGVPGDLIDVRDGQRYLVYDGGTKEIALGEAPGLVYGGLPEGAYLLLASDLSAEGVADGRTLGLVYETDIKAKAGVILWPVNRMFRGR